MAQHLLPNLKTRDSLRGYLKGLALEIGVRSLTDPQFAEELDRRDELAKFRDEFHVPVISELLSEDEIAGGNAALVVLTVRLGLGGLPINNVPDDGSYRYMSTPVTVHVERTVAELYI